MRVGKGDGNGMRGGFNVCLTERRLHVYPFDESAKLRGVHRGLTKKCDINIAETRCIDSSQDRKSVV